MNHPETHMVTADNGPRPAGKPNECFYCLQEVGTPHRHDCVCRRRTVLIEVTIKYAIDVPESWSEEDIEFQRNEGSWCADNIVNEINNIINGPHKCLCGFAKFKCVGEATREDEKSAAIREIIRG